MTKLELIKSNMEENLKDFMEMQQRQIKEFEAVINADMTLDEVDIKLEEMNFEFRSSTELADIIYNHKKYFKELHDYTWDIKAGENND